MISMKYTLLSNMVVQQTLPTWGEVDRYLHSKSTYSYVRDRACIYNTMYLKILCETLLLLLLSPECRLSPRLRRFLLSLSFVGLKEEDGMTMNVVNGRGGERIICSFDIPGCEKVTAARFD